MTLEGRGIPSAGLCLESFEKHARREATLHGLPEISLVILTEDVTGDKLSNVADAEQVQTTAAAIIPEIVSLLTEVRRNV